MDNDLNGGFLLLTPDKAVFAEMLAQLSALDDLSGYLFAERDFLNQFYRGRWQPLPWVCNALKTLPHQHPAVWDPSRVKISIISLINPDRSGRIRAIPATHQTRCGERLSGNRRSLTEG